MQAEFQLLWLAVVSDRLRIPQQLSKSPAFPQWREKQFSVLQEAKKSSDKQKWKYVRVENVIFSHVNPTEEQPV